MNALPVYGVNAVRSCIVVYGGETTFTIFCLFQRYANIVSVSPGVWCNYYFYGFAKTAVLAFDNAMQIVVKGYSQ